MTDIIKPGYTRVTEALSILDDFPNHDEEAVANRKRAAERGTRAHKAIELYHANNSAELKNVDEDILGYCQSYAAWWIDSEATIVKQEQRLYCHDLKISGQIDAIYKFPHAPAYTIVDYKTSAEIDDMIWPLQGNAYNYLAVKNGLNVEPRIIFLHLKKDGKRASVVEYEYSGQLLNMFKCALNMYLYKKSKKRLTKNPIL